MNGMLYKDMVRVIGKNLSNLKLFIQIFVSVMILHGMNQVITLIKKHLLSLVMIKCGSKISKLDLNESPNNHYLFDNPF
jgi:hypothetical protein